jgi:hypothetical protein
MFNYRNTDHFDACVLVSNDAFFLAVTVLLEEQMQRQDGEAVQYV